MTRATTHTIKAENIRAWVHAHTEEETLGLIGEGYVIHFAEENLKTSDAMVLTVLQTAYIFFDAERERRSDRAIEAYYQRVQAGVYIPHNILGYHPVSFTPNEQAIVVRAMYRAVLFGLTCSDIAEWMNQNGVTTIRGNTFTSRAVRQILRNPFYCGDVVFRKAGRVIHDHHTGLVSREVWELVQERLKNRSNRSIVHTPAVDMTALIALFALPESDSTSTATSAEVMSEVREVVEVAA